MYSDSIITRNEKYNDWLVDEIRKKYGIAFEKKPKEVFDSVCKVVKDIITDFCENDLKDVFTNVSEQDVGVPMNEIYDLMRYRLLNGDELINDVDSEILLGLVYVDNGFDYSRTEVNTSTDESINKYKDIFTVWESNPNYKAETIEIIRKRYPIRASYEKYKDEAMKNEDDTQKIDCIYDACMDFHQIMISGGNRILFDKKDDKIVKANINPYDFRNIEKLYEKIFALVQDKYAFHNIALFEKTVGFSYACHLFNFLKDYKSASKLKNYDEMIKKSTKLHAVSLRTTLMEILLSACKLEKFDNNEAALKLWLRFVDELFSKIEELFKEVLKVCWIANYYYYTKSDDSNNQSSRDDFEENGDILFSHELSVRNVCEENAKIFYQVYMELVTDINIKKFKLFYIGPYIGKGSDPDTEKDSDPDTEKDNNIGVFKIRSVEDCFKSVDGESMLKQLINQNRHRFLCKNHEGVFNEFEITIDQPNCEAGEWVYFKSIDRLNREQLFLRIDSAEELKKHYENIRQKEYKRILEDHNAWWNASGFNIISENDVKKAQIFAWIQMRVTNYQLDRL